MITALRAAVISWAVALAVRLSFVVDARGSPFLGHRLIDEQDYHGLALAFLGGSWPGREALFRPPLYPLFLAGAYRAFGDDVWTTRLVQMGVGALAAPLTVALAARVLGSAAQALAAGLVVALLGPLVYYDAQLLAASLDVVLVLTTAVLVLEADGRDHLAWWTAAGAMTGLAATNRGAMLLVAPVVVLWLLVGPGRSTTRSRALRSAATFTAVAALVVFPVAWHNARNDLRPEASYAPALRRSADAEADVSAAGTVGRLLTGRASALGWADGVNLYIGNVPALAGVNRDADVAHFDWFNELSGEPWRGGAREAHEHSAWFKAKTRAFATEHPGSWLRLLGTKVLQVLNGYEVPRGTSPYGERENSSLLSLLLWTAPLRFPTGVLLPLGLVGMALLRRDRRALLVGAFLVTQLAFVVAFFVTARYRLPALPMASVLAVGLVTRLAAGGLPGLRRRGSVVAAALALLVLANLRLPDQPFGRSAIEEYDLAEAFGREGDGDGAFRHVDAALRIAPDFADARAMRGVLFQARGDLPRAVADYQDVLRIDPKNAVATQNLAQLTARP